MKTIATFGLLLCVSIATLSQNRNSIWCFGDSAGIDFRNVSMPVPITTGFDTRGTCASVSDSLGNLLFYSNTRANGYPDKAGLAYNRNHTVMLNGDSLHGNGGYNEMLIIPKPQSSNLYYLFTLNLFFYPGLFYSIIDMEGDSGRGMITMKNILVNDDSVCSTMTAIKHGNGRDWWLIVKGYSANQDSSFYEYLITADSIIQKKIEIGGNSNTNLGNLCFSKDGNKLAFVSFAGLIETFDFNRCTGEFSNTKLVRPQCNPNCAGYFGAAYSASGNVLYVTATGQAAGQDSYLLQFNLLAPDIWASRETLWTASSTRVTAGNLKLGPDDKVYLTCCWISFSVSTYPYQDTVYHTENMNLSVIENPDVVGTGCNLNLFSFYLGGKRTYWGLPNNPDYEMGAMWNSACDSLTNSVHFIEDGGEDLLVYPNPFSNKLYLRTGTSGEFFVFDQLGKLLLHKRCYGEVEELDLTFLRDGIYNLNFHSDNIVFSRRIVKIAHE